MFRFSLLVSLGGCLVVGCSGKDGPAGAHPTTEVSGDGPAAGFPDVPPGPSASPETEKKIRDLIVLFKGSDYEARVEAGEKLLEIGEVAVRPLVLALRDEHKLIRIHAAHVLTSMSSDPTLAPLVRSLALESLIVGLGDHDGHFRLMVVQALASIEDNRAVAPLIARLNDPDVRIRDASAGALKKLTGRDFGDDSGKWRRWHESRR